MREARNAQSNVFDFFAEHEHAQHLKRLPDLLDHCPDILELIEGDFARSAPAPTGARGLSLEGVFRCLILKLVTRQIEFAVNASTRSSSDTAAAVLPAG